MSSEAEALRRNLRFLVEVVEAFGFCPWARGTRESGALTRRVLPFSVDDALAAYQEIAASPALIGLLIFPEADVNPEGLEKFAAEMRARLPKKPPMAIAPFHPDAAFSTKSPGALMPLFRRAPDPTLQLVRFSTLESVKANDGKFVFDGSPEAWARLEARPEPVSDRIARENAEAVEKFGVDKLVALLAEIRADGR